jgi:hypothetical protein
MRLPLSVYVPPSIVIDPKVVKSAKLLFAVNCAAVAGNTRSSFAAGATSPAQFAAVCQLVSAPPPSHVRTVANVVEEQIARTAVRSKVFIVVEPKPDSK